MKKILFILLFSFPIIIQAFPVDSTVFKYLPLNIGNTWIYKQICGFPCGTCYTLQKFKITGTNQINGKTYFLISFSYRSFGTTCQYYPNNITRLYSTSHIMLDSVSGNIYVDENCGTNGRVLSDSLNAKLGDSATICGGGNDERREGCSDTSIVNIFGMNKTKKTFSLPHTSGGEAQSYAKDIGLYYSGWGESFSWWEETLLGCVINGVVYGDTSMLVGIKPISSEIPDKFTLSQNYPNPFNPNTKIQFNIPGSSVVQTFLSVYDIQGKEVATLVNESLKPGSYEVEWDGRQFASGVYFYKLVVEDNTNNGGFTETKKMVLIK